MNAHFKVSINLEELKKIYQNLNDSKYKKNYHFNIRDLKEGYFAITEKGNLLQIKNIKTTEDLFYPICVHRFISTNHIHLCDDIAAPERYFLQEDWYDKSMYKSIYTNSSNRVVYIFTVNKEVKHLELI